ncbi:MAG: hypothetical protein M1358_01605, partial [Chloroflexi bacterium]|nr:hypothetical protein [Chloroflexota bacterium]
TTKRCIGTRSGLSSIYEIRDRIWDWQAPRGAQVRRSSRKGPSRLEMFSLIASFGLRVEVDGCDKVVGRRLQRRRLFS